MATIDLTKNTTKGKDFPTILFCLLYFAVHFIPYAGAVDPMGSQWFYLGILDLLVTVFIFARKGHYDLAIRPVFKNTFSFLYLALFGLAALSVLTAINRTEAWVCYANR